mgnify:FL=1
MINKSDLKAKTLKDYHISDSHYVLSEKFKKKAREWEEKGNKVRQRMNKRFRDSGFDEASEIAVKNLKFIVRAGPMKDAGWNSHGEKMVKIEKIEQL